jgi:hypothetical protein
MNRYAVWVGQGPETGNWAIDLVEVDKNFKFLEFKGIFVQEIMKGGPNPGALKKGAQVTWDNYNNVLETIEEACQEVVRRLWTPL